MPSLRGTIRLLAWCGIAAPVIRLTLILILGSLDPAYSRAGDFTSEGGAEGGPYAPLMNYLGITAVGVLLILFSVGLYLFFRRRTFALIGAVLLAVSGAAFVVVGLYPCGPGCSVGAASPTVRIHLAAGAVAMSAQTLAVLSIGIGVLWARGHSMYQMITLGLGAIAAVSLIVFLGGVFDMTYPGAAQKAVQASTDLWVLFSAGYILTHPSMVHRPPLFPASSAGFGSMVDH